MKIYLTVVGLVYLSLAVWWAVAPAQTSAKVGFALEGGSGRSEFLAVYGGLELGLALVFLMPLVFDRSTAFALVSCVLIHGGLVLCRSAGFALFSGIGSTTVRLAIGEWVILLTGLACWYQNSGTIRSSLQ